MSNTTRCRDAHSRGHRDHRFGRTDHPDEFSIRSERMISTTPSSLFQIYSTSRIERDTLAPQPISAAPPTPIAIPISAIDTPCLSTSRSTLPLPAPRAMRTPISWVRCATVCSETAHVSAHGVYIPYQGTNASGEWDAMGCLRPLPEYPIFNIRYSSCDIHLQRTPPSPGRA